MPLHRVLLIATLAAATACASSTPGPSSAASAPATPASANQPAAAPAQATTATLAGTSWVAVDLAGVPAPEKNPPALDFAADGRLSGSDGCNRVMGNFKTDKDAITFTPMGASMMACPGTEDTERRFHAALKGAGHWRIENGKLLLLGATGQPLATFARQTDAGK